MELNIIDYAIFAVAAIGILLGYYEGFMRSVVGIGSSFLSFIGALLLYQPLARMANTRFGVIEKLVYYVESLDMLNSVENPSMLNAIETSRMRVAQFTPESLNELLGRISLPRPLGRLLTANIETQAFSGMGITSLGDYLSYTVAYMAANIIAFIIIYFLLRALLLLITSALDYMVGFPMLRRCDSLSGGALGFVNALLMLLVLFLALPVAMTFLPFNELRVMVSASRFASIFYDGNFLLNFIKGIF